jgi:hypothetical protein
VFNCGLAAESGAGKSYKQKIVLPAKAWKKPKIPVKDHHVIRAVGLWIWPRYPASLLIGRNHHLHWWKKKGVGRGKQVPSSVKMLIVFYVTYGVVLYKFVPQLQTVNWQHYANKL